MIRHFQIWLIYLIQSATIIAIGFVGLYVYLNDSRATVDAAVQDVLDKGTAISTALVKEFVVLETIANSVAHSASLLPDLTQEQFARLASRIIRDEHSVINLAYAPGLVVRFVYPQQAANAAVIGLDYRVSPRFNEGVDRALEQDRTVLIGPMTIIQGGEALILRVPVGGDETDDFGEQGLVSLVIDIEGLRQQTGIKTMMSELSIKVYHTELDGEEPKLVFGSVAACGPQPLRRSFQILDETWTFCMEPKDGWPTFGADSGWIILIKLLAMFSTALVFIVVNRFRTREAQAKAQLWDAIEAIDDGFALFDKNDRLVIFNTKYRKIYEGTGNSVRSGMTFEELIENGVRNGHYVDTIGNEAAWIEQRLAEHRSASGVQEQKLNNGRWIKVSQHRTSDGGTVALRVDITDLKLAQHEAEAANAAINEFLNNVNHEIRTPLSVIVGFIRFLSMPEVLRSHRTLKQALDNKAHEPEALRAAVEAFVTETKTYADRIQRSASDLHTLVQDTLDMSKVSQGDFPYSPETVDLASLVSECVEHFSCQAAEKSLKLEADVPPCTIRADLPCLRQLLHKLIGNAIKFTDSGEVSVSAKATEDSVLIKVADTGPGIAVEHRERVFEKFWQVDGSAVRQHGGTGQGLAICKAFVELHGGEIWVEPTTGQGSVFYVRLPQSQTPEI